MERQWLTECLRDTLAVFDEAGVPLTTTEVAKSLDLGRRTAYARLERLVEHDRLETKKVGANARVWWRARTATANSDDDTEDGRSEQGSRWEQEFRSLVEATDEYAIFMLDSTGCVQTWNPGAARIKGYDADGILGTHFSTFYTVDDRAAGVPEANLKAAAEAGSIQDEGWRLRDDGSRFWANVTITAIRDTDGALIGYAKVTRDMTDRREYEHRLREEKAFVESLLDTQQDLLYAFDTEGVFLRWNDRFREVTGYTDAEIKRMQPVDFIAERAANETGAAIEQVLNDGDDVTVELPLVTADGDEIPYEFTGGPITNGNERIIGFTGVGRDISERKARERRLERQRDELGSELDEMFERISDGFYALDTDLRVTYLNDHAQALLGLEGSSVIGNDIRETVGIGDRFGEALQEAFEEQTPALVEDYFEPLDGWFESTIYPSESGLSVHFRDISGRKERERELQDRIRQQEVVADLGKRALEERDLETLMAETAGLVADTLDTDYCNVLDLDTEAEELRLRQGVGWNDGIGGEASVSAVEEDSQAAYTLTTEQPVIVEDLTTESRFSGPDLLRSHDVHSGISTIIGSDDDPWGILGTHDTDRKEFSKRDATFVQAVANVLAAAVERHGSEQELVQQHEQLTALNSLNEVIRDITNAVIEQSTREEIEETVCERLAETDSYLFAWIGDVNTATQTVTLRTEAGVEGYLDCVTISVDPDDERSEGPTGRALRTGEIDVVNDIHAESRHDPWRTYIQEYGFRSSAAIPIVHEGTIYGVLNVYAERPNAFTGQEGEIIAQLGEIVGHAIAATERKQALMSDELVELDFRIQDVFGDLDSLADSGGTITIDHTVAVGNGEYLVYGTATPGALDTVRGLVETHPDWEAVTVRSDTPRSFELRVTDPPVISVVASRGGYIDRAVIDDGDLRMTIHLAPTVDVRQVIDAVEEAYPGAEMLRRQQIRRDRDGPHRFQRRLLSDLTDRQRTALEVAYQRGFFEWPRDTTGEEVAESLGVAAPTFHQHLRKAERNVFDTVFSFPMRSTQ